MTPIQVLWIYIILLVAGGVMGYAKARSSVSLVTSLLFAVLLGLCAMGIITEPRAPDLILLVLLVFFGWRLAKTRKFMPGGVMSILTIAALAGRHLL